jgi:peptide/nickel transport system substrate-binding protein
MVNIGPLGGEVMKKAVSIIGIIAMFLLSTVTSAVAEQVQSLKVAITKDENSINPYTYVTGYPGLDMVNLVYDNLFQLDEKNQPTPWLVKDYNVSDDQLTYTFTLHDNAKWHDGTKLTAEDVKFTIEYFLEHPKSRFTNPLKPITSIEVNNETTLKVVLKEAQPNFMIQPLADLPILPKHIWSEVSNPDEETNSVGSGPYILEEHKSGQFYKMKANEEYYLGKPPINEIIFPIIEDTTAMFTALQAGEIDVISANISPELVEQFENNPTLKVTRGAGYSTTLFQLNAEKYPMNEKAFRQAISHAIDTQNLVDTLLLGYAEVGSPGFIHPSSPFFNSSVSFEPNVEEANQLLDESGFKDVDGDGFREGQNGEKIDLTNLVYANNPIRIRTAEIITDSLKEIGIKATVKAMDATTVDSLMWPDFDVSKGRDYDLGIWGWSNTMQLFPDRMVELFHSDPAVGSVNIGGYKNADFDSLAETLKSTVDQAERQKLINNMQIFVADEAPIIPLYYQEIVNAYNPNVYDGYTFQLGKGIFNKMSFASVNTETGVKETEDSTTEEKGAGKSADTQKVKEVSEGNNNAIFMLLGVVVVIGILVFFLRKKGKSKKEDDLDF